MPFIVIPISPLLIKGCTQAEAFIIGSCISIFIAVWMLTNTVHSSSSESGLHRKATRKGFDNIDQRFNTLETFFKFENELDSIQNPYFKRRIQFALQKNLEQFKKDNKHLFEGYLETSPYNNDTYGTEGLNNTKREILAVSSIEDYWEREGFTEEYLHTQYCLIKDRAITIKRIFIGNKDTLKKLKRLMKDQQTNGIEVFYIESDSDYCPDEWKKEDFLIQDNSLVVILQADSHKADNSEKKEIITTKVEIVNDKKLQFEKMLSNAIPFSSK